MRGLKWPCGGRTGHSHFAVGSVPGSQGKARKAAPADNTRAAEVSITASFRRRHAPHRSETRKGFALARAICARRSSKSARTSTCLEAVGATLADIVKTNTYVTDYPEFAKHPDMRMRYFGAATPTSTMVQISRLADPVAMVEIEAIAVIDG
jgi:Endoribonuclease L-PSP